MNPKFAKVGILGGMGPEATVHLLRRVIALRDANDDADHIPLLIDQNPQVPSRIRALIDGTGPSPGPVLADMARRLEAAGVAALAMPCNTAHYFADDIRNATRIPFIDMIEQTVAKAAPLDGRARKVGVLASPAVRLTALYDRALSRFGSDAIYHSEDDRLLGLIKSLKISGLSETARKELRALALDLLGRGADICIVACSEFSMVADALSALPSLDSIDILAGEIIRFSTSGGARSLKSGLNYPTTVDL